MSPNRFMPCPSLAEFWSYVSVGIQSCIYHSQLRRMLLNGHQRQKCVWSVWSIATYLIVSKRNAFKGVRSLATYPVGYVEMFPKECLATVVKSSQGVVVYCVELKYLLSESSWKRSMWSMSPFGVVAQNVQCGQCLQKKSSLKASIDPRGVL